MAAIEYKKPPHFELSPNDFGAQDFSEKWKIDVVMFYDTTSPNNRPRFLFKATYDDGSTPVTSKIQTFICGIPGNAKVTIRIDPAIASWCRWSRKFLPVTAKAPEDDIGGSAHSANQASFKVKKRAENAQRYHHLYLNFELFVGRTDEGRELWADYNYDPDVINPRPPGRVFGDETLQSDHIFMQDVDDAIIVPPPPPASQAKPQIAVNFA